MTNDTTLIARDDLTQLLGSRLCHDLISPLGAIGNGVELLEMSSQYPGISDSPELRLIAEAVAAARGRIQCFRMAFGQASGTQRVGASEMLSLLGGVTTNARLRISLETEADLARYDARMILLAAMCLETALPWGGAIAIRREGAGWQLEATADRTKSDPALWAMLDAAGSADQLPAASEVQFVLLAEAVARARRDIRWSVDSAGARISF